MGGTTGVVLDDVEENESVNGKVIPTNHESSINDSTTDKLEESVSPSIINSLTSIVRNTSNILSVFSSDNSQSSLKISTSKGVQEDQDDCEDKKDHEANAIMKYLCFHLLPYGVDKSSISGKSFSRWLTGIQKSWSIEQPQSPGLSWNDDDPDELGFEVHKITKSLLRRVENEYENRVNKLKYWN